MNECSSELFELAEGADQDPTVPMQDHSSPRAESSPSRYDLSGASWGADEALYILPFGIQIVNEDLLAI